MPLSNTQSRDLNALACPPYSNLALLAETGTLIIERGQGVRVYDANGKDYIEAMAGLWSTALGWGETELADVAAEQMRKLSYGHVFAGKSFSRAGHRAGRKAEGALPLSRRQSVLCLFRFRGQ